MRPALQNWINSADNTRYLQFFAIPQIPLHLSEISNRLEDYYVSLVGELFSYLDTPNVPRSDWAQLGNALLHFTLEISDVDAMRRGIAKEDAALLSAASFYFGNYPASACLIMRRCPPPADAIDIRAACFDFLARPSALRSRIGHEAREHLLIGNPDDLDHLIRKISSLERRALSEGPEEWIAAKLLKRLLVDFQSSNLRAVLPEGYSNFWSPLVSSLIERQPSTWDFFPSQIEAIQRGLLESNETYSLQMPTGAGKTTLCETLLYSHLKDKPQEVAILLVPYRSLASELRGSLVKHLNALGITTRCAYGGTVPTGDEVHALADVQAVVATPEALLGLLGADSSFALRISLVICDEGHLLDGDARGIVLELLLARLKSSMIRTTRFVFMSAIVPNIASINLWLGGTNNTVISSTYKPATAEFSVLTPVDRDQYTLDLLMHPHEPNNRFNIESFLRRDDFKYRNPNTGRTNTYPYNTTKSQIIAAARKTIPMGTSAIFAANKRGAQGAIGIAQSLLEQLKLELTLPNPIDYANVEEIGKVVNYLASEYGNDWVGTQSVNCGFVLHHGDVPQETREVLEALIRSQHVQLVICTSTLAEGVNLPIRCLLLYSVQRREAGGRRIRNMLARDIKNLVGRAGRAGSNTKGLVICANQEQWSIVQPVAMQHATEPVHGALLNLIRRISEFIALHNIVLSNEILEHELEIYPLIDGIDATLIELLSEEIGSKEFISLASTLANQTFAATQLTASSSEHLSTIFNLRAQRLISLKDQNKLTWARATGAKIRLIDSVEQRLLPMRGNWHEEVSPHSEEVRQVIFDWAWTHPELHQKVREAFRLDSEEDLDQYKQTFFGIGKLWMGGMKFHAIATSLRLPLDEVLAVHATSVGFTLQMLVEHGLSLLDHRLQSDGIELAGGIRDFPEHLRFGTPNRSSLLLASSGVRHRSAYVALGQALENIGFVGNFFQAKRTAAQSLAQFEEGWIDHLGELVYRNTILDIS